MQTPSDSRGTPPSPSSSEVRFPLADGGELQAYQALPMYGSGPGIVLMHDSLSITPEAREIADWYAAHGFAVICPDLSACDEAGAVTSAARAMATLRDHASCIGVVCSVGFGSGGKLAYLLGTRHQPACVVAYYPVGIEQVLAEASTLGAPLLVHAAGKDARCPPPVQEQLVSALSPVKHVRIHRYPNQSHGFARWNGEQYDAGAAELANLRTLAFLVKHVI